MDASGDQVLVKIAVFCITMSIIATCMVAWYASGTGDYDYDTIQGYRSELVDFTGSSLVNNTPWVLTGVYTPFIPQNVDDEDIPDHLDDDGWLYGRSVTSYSEIGKVADIHLDKYHKSNQLLTVDNPYEYRYQNGKEWWNGGNDFGVVVIDPSIVKFFGKIINQDTDDTGYEYKTGQANNWSYTGYRYTFDPTLPFSNGTSSKDGTLSLVWYDIPNVDSGLSGALEVYGTKSNGSSVLLAHYSASDIIAAYQSNGGYAQTYDFNFDGVHLALSIRFDPTVYEKYGSLRSAWDDGAWSMAISSASAGNFFDVDNSNTFSVTAGTMFDTFIQIYTFDYPHFEDAWVDVVLWLLVGLPMSLGMLCITMRMVGGVFKIF